MQLYSLMILLFREGVDQREPLSEALRHTSWVVGLLRWSVTHNYLCPFELFEAAILP